MANPRDQSFQSTLAAKLRRDWEIVAMCEYSLAKLRERIKDDGYELGRRDEQPGSGPREP